MATLYPKNILLVSYDAQLLIARRVLLEQDGYQVSSALGFKEAQTRCRDEVFDLLILGHSIPITDKESLIKAFRTHSSAPILSLWARNEMVANGVDYLAFSDAPENLLANVASVLARKAAGQQAAKG